MQPGGWEPSGGERSLPGIELREQPLCHEWEPAQVCLVSGSGGMSGSKWEFCPVHVSIVPSWECQGRVLQEKVSVT